MKTKKIVGSVTLILFGIIFGAVLVTGFGWVSPTSAGVQIGTTEPPVKEINADAQAFNNAFIAVSEKVTPSIVSIRVVSEVKGNLPDNFKFFFPFREDIPREQQGGGSGVIISKEGYILTNNHVVKDAKMVEVGLHDKRLVDAQVVGTDPLTDLAVIKIDADDLNVCYLGDSDNIKVGEWVMAIGNPLSLSSTVTAGIVSATGRNINIIDNSYGVEDFIQTDAAINPGNSGGALVNLRGEVIGINTAIATDGMSHGFIGYGFAIPINLAKSVAEDLIENGKVSRGYIGVSISRVDDATAKALGMDKPKGVMIQNIVEDGAASKEDIKEGDIILKVDDTEVNEPNELQSYIARQRAGETVKITLYRDGDEIVRNVTLKGKDEDEDVKTVASRGKDVDKEKEAVELTIEDVGLTVKNLSSKDYEDFDIEEGIKITNVKRYGRAFNQNLFKNLVIVEVDRKPIDSVKEFEDIIESKKGQAVLLKVRDIKGTTRFVGLEIPN
ncbi:MAG: Do family serine endopeptidase [Ignavibacteria bacterium]|jgi:serine protease Do